MDAGIIMAPVAIGVIILVMLDIQIMFIVFVPIHLNNAS
jgi:hypothetical protein